MFHMLKVLLLKQLHPVLIPQNNEVNLCDYDNVVIDKLHILNALTIIFFIANKVESYLWRNKAAQSMSDWLRILVDRDLLLISKNALESTSVDFSFIHPQGESQLKHLVLRWWSYEELQLVLWNAISRSVYPLVEKANNRDPATSVLNL
jgi:hypothetical protein